jgi:Uma2 family endonuclease
VTTTTTDLMTAEQFFDWVHRPENAGKHYELERGRVVEVSRPGERHGRACVNAGYVLESYIRRRRQGYACGNDTGVVWEHAPDVVRGPDLIFYDETRQFSELNPRYSDEVPTLIIEVLSPNDRPNPVTRRITQFLRWGVRLAWVIDPEDQTVSVYRPGREPEVLDATQELTGDGVLPDFRCPVAEFFYSPAGQPPPQ